MPIRRWAPNGRESPANSLAFFAIICAIRVHCRRRFLPSLAKSLWRESFAITSQALRTISLSGNIRRYLESKKGKEWRHPRHRGGVLTAPPVAHPPRDLAIKACPEWSRRDLPYQRISQPCQADSDALLRRTWGSLCKVCVA